MGPTYFNPKRKNNFWQNKLRLKSLNSCLTHRQTRVYATYDPKCTCTRSHLWYEKMVSLSFNWYFRMLWIYYIIMYWHFLHFPSWGPNPPFRVINDGEISTYKLISLTVSKEIIAIQELSHISNMYAKIHDRYGFPWIGNKLEHKYITLNPHYNFGVLV